MGNTPRKAPTPRKSTVAKPPRPPKVKIRLIKVIVQPVVVIDHGDHLEEVQHDAVAVPATIWPNYSSEQFPAELAAWEHRLNNPITTTEATQ